MLKPRGLYKFYRIMPHYSGKKQQKEKLSDTTLEDFKVQIKGILHSYVVDEEFSGKCPLSVRWSLEDKVVVYDGMNCLGMLSVSSVIGSGQEAKLKGKLKSPAHGQSSRLTMVLGKGIFVNDVINDEKVKDLSMQDGSNAPYVAYAVVDYDPNQSAMTGVVADFHPVISVLGIELSGLEVGTKINDVTIENVGAKCRIVQLDDGSCEVQTDRSAIVIRMNDKKRPVTDKITLYVAIVPGIVKTSRKQILSVVLENGMRYDAPLVMDVNKLKPGHVVVTSCRLRPLLPFTAGFHENGTRRTVNFAPGNLYLDSKSSTFHFESLQYDYRTVHGIENDSAVIEGEKKEDGTPKDTLGIFQYSSNNNERDRDNDVLFTNETPITPTKEFIVESVSGWRTLSYNEWHYLLFIRKVNGETGYGKTCIWAEIKTGAKNLNVVKGLVIFPDMYNGDNRTTNLTYIPEDCVFLPAVGCTHDDALCFSDKIGYYWLSMSELKYNAYCIYFLRGDAYTSIKRRQSGCPIRLVTESKQKLETTNHYNS